MGEKETALSKWSGRRKARGQRVSGTMMSPMVEGSRMWQWRDEMGERRKGVGKEASTHTAYFFFKIIRFSQSNFGKNNGIELHGMGH